MTHKEADGPFGPVVQSNNAIWPMAPQHLTSVSIKLTRNLQTRQLTDGVKRPMSLVWLSVIFTNVYAWKCLVSHDQPQQRNLYKERIPQNTCINENLPYKERPSPPRNEDRSTLL